MIAPRAWLVLAVLALGAVSCTPGLRQPVRVASPGGELDLREWNFSVQGPVIPQDWLWDSDTLWSPVEGRPSALPPAQTLGAPETGGSLALKW